MIPGNIPSKEFQLKRQSASGNICCPSEHDFKLLILMCRLNSRGAVLWPNYPKGISQNL